MPRPNPPRKRPRRRPDAVERNTRAEVSLTKQTAQVKERSGPEPKSANAKPQPKAAKPGKGAPPPRVRRIDEPYVPWAKRSYAILVCSLAVLEIPVAAVWYLSLPANEKISFPSYLIGTNYNPLIVLPAAILAAPIAKIIAKESRALRFMESAMVGIIQYFIWLLLFVALTFVVGNFGSATAAPASGTSTPAATATALPTTPASPAATAAPTATPAPASAAAEPVSNLTAADVVELVAITLISYVGTFYLYPPLYKRMRLKPPPPRGPRPPKETKPSPDAKAATASTRKSNVDRLDDEAAARDPQPKDPTP